MKSEQIQKIIPRIMRDMSDGVLALDGQGNVLFLNDNGRRMLGKEEIQEGTKFASAFFGPSGQDQNDDFNQFVLDAVYDKENTHRGQAAYRLPDGRVRQLHLTSSFLTGEDGSSSGVVVVFTDVTEVENLHRQRRESSTIFAVLMICVCGYLFLWSLMRYLHIEPAPWVMTLIIEGISILMFIIILKTTSFSLQDIGLKVKDAKRTFIPDILIAVGGCVIMVVGKIIILKAAPGFFPAGRPFWDWSTATAASIFYPLTVILQEFLARGVMQVNLKRIFDGKYAGVLSIVVSALVFGALHVAYGLPLMLGAAVLLGTLGVLFDKQENIWGVSIVHYAWGEVFGFLGFM